MVAGSNTGETGRGRPAEWPALAKLPVPMKVLLSAILLTLALAMFGALGQIIVHDIIPTFFAGEVMSQNHSSTMQEDALVATDAQPARGDLFAADPLPKPTPVPKPFYQEEQFVWLLKWTHIHLFGMSMIFILLGAVTIFLDMPAKARCWLVALPFVGVVVDIAAMWLKAFLSPAFFWMHIPGGGLFAAIFTFVFVRAMKEMWRQG